MVNTLVIQNERRWFGGLSNLAILPDGRQVVAPRFRLKLEELQAPFAFANGLGATYVIDSHRALLENQVGVQPRRPVDHMKLLATINRRVADKTGKKTGPVSPFCQVTYVNADARTSPESQAFLEKGESVPFDMSVVFLGVDLSGAARRVWEHGKPLSRGEAPPEVSDEEANGELKRRP
jgi:hypothetical protein